MNTREKEELTSIIWLLAVASLVLYLTGCASLRSKRPIAVHGALTFAETDIIVQAVLLLNREAGFQAVLTEGEGYPVYFQKEEQEGNIAATATLESSRCVIRLRPTLFTTQAYLIETVLWHELGHCRGLGHEEAAGHIMSRQVSKLSTYSAAVKQHFFERMR